MRINKYLRNRAFRIKHWKRIRSQEHPYRTCFPYLNGYFCWSYEDQIQSHFRWITERARYLENGKHGGLHAPKSFRKPLNDEWKAQQKVIMTRIRKGDYDAEFIPFKRTADWLYF